MTNWQNTSGALIVLIVATPAGLVLTGITAKLLRIREMNDYLKSIPLLARLRRSQG
jgi:hypothetical protein